MRTFNVQHKWQKVVSAALFLVTANYCLAQTAQNVAEPGDPARWYQNDTTQHDYAVTLIKEAQAAYNQAQAECRSGNQPSRKTCLKEAQDQFKSDMADAKAQNAKASR